MSTIEQQSNVITELAVEPQTEFARMDIAEGDWNSIYIPYLSPTLALMNHNDMIHPFVPKYLRDFLEKVLRIGKVRRIDFVDRDVPSSSVPVKAAFVHFEYWYDTRTAQNLREKLNVYGQYRQKGYMYRGKRCNFYQTHAAYPNGNLRMGYFDIRINHKPIEETECDRNVHQLYAENLLLEQELAARNATIELLRHELQLIRDRVTIGPDTVIDYSTDNEMNRTVYHEPDDEGQMTMAELEA